MDERFKPNAWFPTCDVADGEGFRTPAPYGTVVRDAEAGVRCPFPCSTLSIMRWLVPGLAPGLDPGMSDTFRFATADTRRPAP